MDGWESVLLSFCCFLGGYGSFFEPLDLCEAYPKRQKECAPTFQQCFPELPSFSFRLGLVVHDGCVIVAPIILVDAMMRVHV